MRVYQFRHTSLFSDPATGETTGWEENLARIKNTQPKIARTAIPLHGGRLVPTSAFQIPSFTPGAWAFLLIAAFCSGMSKAGLAGISMLGVTLTAMAMDGLSSSGVVLPLLIFADLLAASTFRKNVHWEQIRKLAMPVATGLILGWMAMRSLQYHRELFRPLVGIVVIMMLGVQLLRQFFPEFDSALPHSKIFAWVAGILTGMTTMVANAAGPVASVYMLILALPKLQLVSTMAWLFLFVNIAKVPLSLNLGLINGGSLALNLCQAPSVILGLWTGKKLVARIPQQAFQWIILAMAGASAIWLMLS